MYVTLSTLCVRACGGGRDTHTCAYPGVWKLENNLGCRPSGVSSTLFFKTGSIIGLELTH